MERKYGFLEKLTASENEEFHNVAKNQPVPAGNVLSKQTIRFLVDKKLVFWFNEDPDVTTSHSGYCLTELGDKEMKLRIEAAKKLASKSVIGKS